MTEHDAIAFAMCYTENENRQSERESKIKKNQLELAQFRQNVRFSLISLLLDIHNFYRRLSSSSLSWNIVVAYVVCVIVIIVVLYADLRLCRSNGLYFRSFWFNSTQHTTRIVLSSAAFFFCIDTAITYIIK